MANNIGKLMQNNPAKFGGKLMQVLSESNIQSHVWHLQTKAYSQHMALNNYYDCIVGLTDSLLETYQGLHNTRISGSIVINIDSNWTELKVTPYFKALRTTLMKMYTDKNLEAGCVKNIMDEILALIDKTLYLLSLKG